MKRMHLYFANLTFRHLYTGITLCLFLIFNPANISCAFANEVTDIINPCFRDNPNASDTNTCIGSIASIVTSIEETIKASDRILKPYNDMLDSFENKQIIADFINDPGNGLYAARYDGYMSELSRTRVDCNLKLNEFYTGFKLKGGGRFYKLIDRLSKTKVGGGVDRDVASFINKRTLTKLSDGLKVLGRATAVLSIYGDTIRAFEHNASPNETASAVVTTAELALDFTPLGAFGFLWTASKSVAGLYVKGIDKLSETSNIYNKIYYNATSMIAKDQSNIEEFKRNYVLAKDDFAEKTKAISAIKASILSMQSNAKNALEARANRGFGVNAARAFYGIDIDAELYDFLTKTAAIDVESEFKNIVPELISRDSAENQEYYQKKNDNLLKEKAKTDSINLPSTFQVQLAPSSISVGSTFHFTINFDKPVEKVLCFIYGAITMRPVQGAANKIWVSEDIDSKKLLSSFEANGSKFKFGDERDKSDELLDALDKAMGAKAEKFADSFHLTISVINNGSNGFFDHYFNPFAKLNSSTATDGTTVIKNDKRNIKTSATLTKPTISPSSVEAGKTVSVTTTSDNEIPADKAVFLVLNNNVSKPYKMKPVAVKTWSYDLVLSKAGSNQVKVYLGALDGSSSDDGSSSASTGNVNVIPTAKVIKVAPDKPEVVDGNSMRFTATVSGTVDEANGDQVILWLDSYKQVMQRVSGTQTWVTTVTDIASANGKRDYTARVQNGDAYSAEAQHGTLTVKLSDAILIVEAHETSSQSRRIDTIKLNDHVHFFAETVGTVNGAVRVKLNEWSPPPLVLLSNGKWRTAESIPIQQAENKSYYAYIEVKGQEAVKSSTKQLKVIADTGLVCPSVANTGDLLDAELLVDRSKVSVKNGKLIIDTCGEDSGERELGFSESGSGWKWPGITIKEKYCGTFKIVVQASDNKTYTCTTSVNSKDSIAQKAATTPQLPKTEPYKEIKCIGNTIGSLLTLNNNREMTFNCAYTDAYYADRGLEGRCCVAGVGCNTFKLQQNVANTIKLYPGKNSCDVFHDDGQLNHTEHDHLDILVPDTSQDSIKKLYQQFAEYYNSKDDSQLRSLISDDWESVGDGTTLADLEMNLRSSFRIFDQVSYTIQNLQIASMGSGKFKATYDVLIKGQIYKNRINHEEKSSVSEEVMVDANGKAKISKTLNGRFWYVQ